jgi:hypothetical protein
MKKLWLLPALLLTCVIALTTFAAPKPTDRGSLYHVVNFKFKDTATPEQIKGVETAFAALPTSIPQIKSLEWGTNISPEKLDKGFTHCFVLTFKTEKDRDAYLVHPQHKEFGKLVGPTLADGGVLVVDFWAKK